MRRGHGLRRLGLTGLALYAGAASAATPPPEAPTLSGSYPAAYYGQSYSQALTITGGTAPYTYTLVSGSLPGGLSLAVVGSTLVLSGTPNAGGDFTFAVKVTDANTQDSNTITTTNMRTNMFANSTYSMKRGKKTRVGYAGDPCGYLGSTATFATDLTLSGTGSTDWKCQNVVTQTVSSQTLTNQLAGVAPAGVGAGNNDWNDVWPTSGSAADLYPLTLTHTATGQTCAVTIDTDFTQTHCDRTYSSANCITVGADYEFRNPSSGATDCCDYISRNANEGGWVMIRKGITYGTNAANTYAGLWIGGSGFLNGTVALTRGTFDTGLATTGTEAGTHGDQTRGRVTEGWEGGNYTLVSSEEPFTAGLYNIYNVIPGVIFYQLNLVAPDNSGGGALFARADDTWADCCSGTRIAGGTASGQCIMRYTPGSGSFPRYLTVTNSKFDGANGNLNAIYGWLLEPRIAGNLFINVPSDCVQLNIDLAHARFPVGATAEGYFGRNVTVDQNYIEGAHGDFLQFYIVNGTSGTLGGTMTVEYNMGGGYTMQGIYNGGGSSTTGKFSIISRNNVLMSADQAGQQGWVNAQLFDSRLNTILHDYNNPSFVSGNTPGYVEAAGTSVDITILDNVAHRNDTSLSYSGTLTGNVWTNTSQGHNYLFSAANSTTYGAAFTATMPVGGFHAACAGIDDFDTAYAAVAAQAIPKAGSSLKRADNTGPGAIAQGSATGVSTITWNDGVTAWAA